MRTEYEAWMEERRRVAARLQPLRLRRANWADMLILSSLAVVVGMFCAWAL